MGEKYKMNTNMQPEKLPRCAVLLELKYTMTLYNHVTHSAFKSDSITVGNIC